MGKRRTQNVACPCDIILLGEGGGVGGSEAPFGGRPFWWAPSALPCSALNPAMVPVKARSV